MGKKASYRNPHKKVVAFWMSRDLLAAVDALAVGEGLSRSRMASELLRDALRDSAPMPIFMALQKAEEKAVRSREASRDKMLKQLRRGGVPIPDE